MRERLLLFGEEPRQRRELRHHRALALGVGRVVAVDDVRQPPADDLARVVVRERVVQARVPLPVADLAQVQELERDAVAEDLRVGVAVVAEIAGGDDGVELLLLRHQLGLALLLGGGAELGQGAVEAVVAHEGGQVRLGAEQPVEVALDERVELARVLAGGGGPYQQAH